jgi:hypothetical protein
MKFLVENYSPKESWLEEAYSFARKPDIINYLDDLLKK